MLYSTCLLLFPFAAMGAADADVVKRLQDLKSKDGLAPNAKMESMLAVLQQASLCYKACMKPTDFIIHPHNRGGSMVNAHDVHEKGLKILQLGVRPSLLIDSVAIEVSTDNSVRDKQFGANRDLVEKSNGMLAPILGSERQLVCMLETVVFCFKWKTKYLFLSCTCMQVHDDFFLTHNSLFQGLHAPGQRIRWGFLEDSNGRSRASEAMQ